MKLLVSGEGCFRNIEGSTGIYPNYLLIIHDYLVGAIKIYGLLDWIKGLSNR